MKIKPIYILFFSLISSMVFSQLESAKAVKKQEKYKPNITIGIDVLNAGIAIFSDRKLFQGFISTDFRKNLIVSADIGYDTNLYRKNGYDASAKGPFLKIGAAQMLIQDTENRFNGFYLGAKIAGSFYKQEYHRVPVRGFQVSDSYTSYPSSSQSSYWFEAAIGGRVQLFDSPFYIDVNFQPRYLVYTTKQDEIKPMIIPGFGKSSNSLNFGVAWNLCYTF